ncbi:MAG: class I tRNA ligase family protein [Candidatus Aminicenantes bacterium]|nr:class I tRNA ligase family protein [Candidatus Aminicenantes bacterium]
MTENKQNKLPKHYQFSEYEEKIYQSWLESGVFSADPDNRDNRYVIMMPLPNVTGALHMGHAMDNVMQDLLIRWHRMMGDNTLWMPGTDHAGIATQAVVEKRLFELEGKTRRDIGREALVAKIWAWKDEYQKRIIKQQQRMGCSCDWDRMRFTMDKVCTRAVREAFYRLFQDGLIYRGNRLVNWDCQLQTAVSDDEIEYEKVQGHFWLIQYPVIDPAPNEPQTITVATTRPETMLGDTAVACNPEPEKALNRAIASIRERMKKASKKDKPQLKEFLQQTQERKKNLLPQLLEFKHMAEDGRKVRLPLLDRELPLILDEWAKPELGSGCVKITPGHDPNDYDVWKRHKDEIDLINILNPDGSLNSNAGPYAQMDRFKARDQVVSDLEKKGFLKHVEDRVIEIAHSDRSKTPIEPYVSKQWFIHMGDLEGGIVCGAGTGKEFRGSGLAQIAIDAIDRAYHSSSGRRLTFHPDHIRYSGTYKSWLAEKRDWCISRQLWWGHRIPIWHAEYDAQELAQLVPELLGKNSEELCTWIADTEGNLHSVESIPQLEKEKKFNLLVCLRNKSSEDKFAADLEAAGLKQDPDVLDTWFSSALWPFSTLGWPDPETAQVDPGQKSLGRTNGPDCLSYYYPGSCLVTGRDIITLWVARMTIMGLYLLGDVPFTDCFIHANIQDGKGERMSKSKGNGIDPEDIIDKYGADSMRYILCDMQTGTQDMRLPVQAISPYTDQLVDLATAQHGQTIFTYICPETGKEFDVLGTMSELPTAKIISQRFDVGQAFCTKLWNAARFALNNLGEHTFFPLGLEQLYPEDRWILSRLSRIIQTVTEELEAYNPSGAVGAAREFFWAEFCDWYLEFIKPRFKDPESAPVARSVLALCLDQILRLFHPIVPFITEALWEKLNQQCPERGLQQKIPSHKILAASDWPQSNKEWENDSIETDMRITQEVIRALRNLRSRYNISPKKKLKALLKASGKTAQRLKNLQDLIRTMGVLSSLGVSPKVQRPSTSATQVVEDVEVFLAGLIDPDKERKRLNTQMKKLKEDAAKSESKLGNEHFVKKAPAEVVQEEKQRLNDIRSQLNLVKKNLRSLEDK